MNSIIGAVVCLVATLAVVQSVPIEPEAAAKLIANAKNAATTCATKHNVPAETALKFLNHDAFLTIKHEPSLDCFSKCVFEGLNYLKEKNEVDHLKVLELNAAIGRDATIVNAKLEKCHADHSFITSCESAFKAFDCFERA